MAGRLSDAVLAACGRDEPDIADPGVVRELAGRCGCDVDALFARAAEPAMAERCRAVTDDDHARGTFGSPTWIVGDERFRDQDRMDFLERAQVTQG